MIAETPRRSFLVGMAVVGLTLAGRPLAALAKRNERYGPYIADHNGYYTGPCTPATDQNTRNVLSTRNVVVTKEHEVRYPQIFPNADGELWEGGHYLGSFRRVDQRLEPAHFDVMDPLARQKVACRRLGATPAQLAWSLNQVPQPWLWFVNPEANTASIGVLYPTLLAEALRSAS